MPTLYRPGSDQPKLPDLPARGLEIIRSIENGSVLGASRTIRLINEVLCLQADQASADSSAAMSEQLRQTADYLIATRGALSPAVGNAIRLVLRGLEQVGSGGAVADIRQFVHERTEAFNRQSLAHVAQIAQYGANLLRNGETVLAYDYSSTVTGVFRRAAEEGKLFHVVIPESRTLDGGMPILREAVELGHRVTFTVDVAMGRELRRCGAVLVGVESLVADGGFWNTVGTGSLAVLARYYRVPFYAATELLKFDLQSVKGIGRNVVRRQIKVFEYPAAFPRPENVLVECDDLEFTPHELVSAYITEEGLLPPVAAPMLARTLLEG